MKYIYLTAFLLFSSIAIANDSGGSGGGGDSRSSDERAAKLDIHSEMRETRALIEKMKYKPAIRKLNAIIRQDRRNADAWNLLGYSQRKIGKYRKAKKAYKKALKYNPQHKGALEYQGELFILLKDIDSARVNQQKLAELCPAGCEELSDLNRALAEN